MEVLSKYTKSKNVTNVENISQTEYLKDISNGIKTTQPDDYENPYTFSDWYLRNTGIISNNENRQYEQYLKDWYAGRYTPSIVESDLKNDYIAFLKNLTLVLNKEDKTNILNDIDWDNVLDVEQVIPLYVKKLKEIAIYFINKRESLKTAKLKYNMSGANQALEKLFYEYLLKAFTKRDYVLNVPDETLLSTFPELSGLSGKFKIEIEELYDDNIYFDKNPLLSASQYFNLTSGNVTAFYDTMNISPSVYEWLFKTGFSQLCANNPLFIIMDDLTNSEYPLSSYTDLDNKILNEYYKFKLTNKYLGENQNYISGGYYILDQKELTFELQTGNNLFYWPSGETIDDFIDINLDLLPVISSTLVDSGATGNKNYLKSDKIFVRTNNAISGAWLKHNVVNTQYNTMCAYLYKDVENVFQYPFPGYGLSTIDFNWTGPQLDNLDKTYESLDEDNKTTIKNAYWTFSTANSSLCAKSIHDTNLIKNGSTAGQYYNDSDHITIRQTLYDSNKNAVYYDDQKHIWLYKFEKTDLPIKRGKNYLQWPLERYESSDTTSLKNVLTSQCAPIALSSISNEALIGARAGYDLSDSDIIYKLDRKDGNPIECAFLSGTPITNLNNTTFTSNATGVIQNSLFLRCNPNTYTTFIWTDEDTPINDIKIKNVKHQPDCPYLFEDIYSLNNENPSDEKLEDYRLWQKCECKAIVYSPLGHPGTNYDDYNGKSDYIFLDMYPYQFNKTVWIGQDGRDYKYSSDFAWFKLDGEYKIEPDVGWGSGSWSSGGVSANGPFILKKGYQYKYYRNPLNHSQTYLSDGTVPYLIIKNQYTNNTTPVWTKAVANSEGVWESFDEISDMTLYPNDYLVYDHIDSNWHCITSIGDLGESITYESSTKNLTSNRWINYDFVTSGQNVELVWPDTLYNNGPTLLAFQLDLVIWGITPPGSSQTIYNTLPNEIFTVFTDRLGTWVVDVTGRRVDTHTYDIHTNVANFTVTSAMSTVTLTGNNIIKTFYSDTINISLNVPISGWNYTTNVYDTTSNGGRPFWATASDADDKTTKHKGIDVYGGGIRFLDDYVPITQPEKSDVELILGTVINYKPLNNILWTEDLTFNTNITSNNWCKLTIDTTKVATLSDFLYNLNSELIVSATDEISDIILLPKINYEPILINYWAINPFVWKQTVTNSSLGIPPTGGILVPLTSGILLEAQVPWANLTNRHYPTVASVPLVDKLYTKKSVGGYFTPKKLGVTTFLSKNNENVLDTSQVLISGNRGLSAVFQNIDTYVTDMGLTLTDQITPVSCIKIDSSWMKGSITEYNKSGTLINPSYYQQFIPYQTKYEINKRNDIGLEQQNDNYDPWDGEEDSNWRDTTNSTPSFTKEYNIDNWYAQLPALNKKVWQWKCDIFGNQYSLLKTLSSGESMYDKKVKSGDLWVRNTNNFVNPASTLLNDLFVNFSNTVYPNLTSEIYNIKDFDVWYDTIMLRTPNYLIFNKINLDYETGNLSFDINNSHILNLTSNGDNKFAGTWFFEKEKSVTLAILVSTVSAIYPQLLSLNLDNNNLTYLYNKTDVDTNELSSLSLTYIEDPVFTYNVDSLMYNLTFITKNNNYQSFMIGNISITNYGDTHEINNVSVITPLK